MYRTLLSLILMRRYTPGLAQAKNGLIEFNETLLLAKNGLKIQNRQSQLRNEVLKNLFANMIEEGSENRELQREQP